MIDINTGTWLDNQASIGAGSDSFYEYLFKSYVLFGDSEFHGNFISVNFFFLKLFFSLLKTNKIFKKKIYGAVKKHLMKDHHYYTADYQTGNNLKQTIDSLSAFWSALQVISGDVTHAVENHLQYYEIVQSLGLIPEVYYPIQKRYDRNTDDYHLRPEFIESTYYLYEATKHPLYRRIATDISRSINVIILFIIIIFII